MEASFSDHSKNVNNLHLMYSSLSLRAKCGLPPPLLFPSESPEEHDNSVCNQQSWKNQLMEQELILIANNRIKWLLGQYTIYYQRHDVAADVHPLPSTSTEDGAPLTNYDLKQIAGAIKSSPIQPKLLLQCATEGKTSDDTEFSHYWYGILNKSNLDWYKVLLYPLEEAVAEIFEIYNLQQGDATTYFQYQAAESLCRIQNTILPSLNQALQQKQNKLHHVELFQKEVEIRCNKAFEQWDDYCMNVLKVESDVLPLCPLDKNNATAMSNYTSDIEKCVIESLRNEFHLLSESFVSSCYRKEIVEAIEYYRLFSKFISQGQSDSTCYDGLFGTLHHFASENSNTSSLEEFKTSASTRVRFISELQQLEGFLSCRKRDINGFTSRGVGHIIAEAIDMEWAQFSMKQSTSKYAEIDIDKYLQAVHDVQQQIVGDGAKAKRLRLLADAIGHPHTHGTSGQFKLLCQKAANLSRQMTILDSQSKALAHAIKISRSSANAAKSCVIKSKNRVHCISEGLESDAQT